MTAFRIDKLTFTKNGSKYNLSGETNIPGGPPVPANSAVLAGDELVIDITGMSGTDHVEFTIDDIDFVSATGPWFRIIFHDTANNTRKDNGGVIIKDTKYPPPVGFLPYVEISGLTSMFDIDSLILTRNGTAGNFKVEVTLKYTSTKTLFTAPAAPVLQQDTARNSQSVLRLNVVENIDGQPHNNVSLPFPILSSLNLDDPEGIAFIVIEKNSSLCMADDKLALFQIEN